MFVLAGDTVVASVKTTGYVPKSYGRYVTFKLAEAKMWKTRAGAEAACIAQQELTGVFFKVKEIT